MNLFETAVVTPVKKRLKNNEKEYLYQIETMRQEISRLNDEVSRLATANARLKEVIVRMAMRISGVAK